MKYCKYCGKTIEDNQKCDCNEAVAHRSKSQKIIIVGAAAALVVILTVVLALCLNKGSDSSGKVDPFDYTEVTFTGYNAYGEANVEYNAEALIEELIGKEPQNAEYEEWQNWIVKYQAYSEGIDYSYSPHRDLSNGDKVTVTFTVKDAISKNIKSGKKTFTVSGLKNTSTVDVFKDVDVQFTGLSGEVYASIQRSSNNAALQACTFKIDPKNNLSSGDRVTVTLSEDSINTLLKEHGLIPVSTSKEYTVPALAKYVTSPSELPQNVLKQIADRFLLEIQEDTTDTTMFTYDNFQYVGTYWMTKKETASASAKTRLEFVVSYDTYLDGSLWDSPALALSFTNIIINADGTLDLSYEDGYTSVFSREQREKDFNIVEVTVN